MKLLIVDDHTLFRSGLAHLLQSLEPSPSVVESADLATSMQQLDTHDDLDLVLLDLKLADSVGADSLIALRKHSPEVPIVVLSGEQSPKVISENTVKAHLSAIFRILGARNRTEAEYFAARAGVPME